MTTSDMVRVPPPSLARLTAPWPGLDFGGAGGLLLHGPWDPQPENNRRGKKKRVLGDFFPGLACSAGCLFSFSKMGIQGNQLEKALCCLVSTNRRFSRDSQFHRQPWISMLQNTELYLLAVAQRQPRSCPCLRPFVIDLRREAFGDTNATR